MVKKKFYITTTIPTTLNFFKGNLAFLNEHFQVKAISSDKAQLAEIKKREGIDIHCIPMRREISLLNDFVCLLRFIWLFIKERPDIVHGNTPKAALLSMFASKITGVKNRVYMCHGLRYQGTTGFKRKLLMRMEKLTCSSASRVICVSNGVKSTLISEGLCKAEKAMVILNGSAAGLDFSYFKKHDDNSAKDSIRTALNIGADDFAFIFVGRIVGDKGVNELVKAFTTLVKVQKNTHLILAGPEENDLNPIDLSTKELIKRNKNIHAVGRISNVIDYLSVSDSLVLPSYREGFGMVLLEAGAMELPCIATDIIGCNEIIINRENGLIVPSKDVNALKEAMITMIEDKELYLKMKNNARRMVKERYEQKMVWNALLEEYKRLLK